MNAAYSLDTPMLTSLRLAVSTNLRARPSTASRSTSRRSLRRVKVRPSLALSRHQSIRSDPFLAPQPTSPCRERRRWIACRSPGSQRARSRAIPRYASLPCRAISCYHRSLTDHVDSPGPRLEWGAGDDALSRAGTGLTDSVIPSFSSHIASYTSRVYHPSS